MGQSATLVLIGALSVGTTSLVVLNLVVVPALFPVVDGPVEVALGETPGAGTLPGGDVPLEIDEPGVAVHVPDSSTQESPVLEPAVEEPFEVALLQAGAEPSADPDEPANNIVANADDTEPDEPSPMEVEVPIADEEGRWVVTFAHASTHPQRATRALDAAMEFYRAHSDVRVTLVGHADIRGEEGFNLRLSRGRAESIARLLRQRGVPQSAISLSFHGESRLVDQGEGAAAHARNRRVEIEIRGQR